VPLRPAQPEGRGQALSISSPSQDFVDAQRGRDLTQPPSFDARTMCPAAETESPRRPAPRRRLRVQRELEQLPFGAASRRPELARVPDVAGDQHHACDFFTVETVFLRRISVLFFITNASRRVWVPAHEEPDRGV
jgi:hypothetical protein